MAVILPEKAFVCILSTLLFSMSIFLKEEEKVLEARPVVEMLLNQI